LTCAHSSDLKLVKTLDNTGFSSVQRQIRQMINLAATLTWLRGLLWCTNQNGIGAAAKLSSRFTVSARLREW